MAKPGWTRRKFFQAGGMLAIGAGAGVAGDRLVSTGGPPSPSPPPGATLVPIPPERFGAVGDGQRDDAGPLARAAAAANKAGGGTIALSAGKTYRFLSTLDLSNFQNVAFVSYGGSTLLYGGRGGPAIRMASASHALFYGVRILYSDPAFSGHLVDTDHGSSGHDPAHNRFELCAFGGTDSTTIKAASLVRLNNAIETAFVDCTFRYSQVAVLGRDPDYSNVITFERCAFRDQVVVPLKNAGQSWAVRGCTFEPMFSRTRAARRAGAYLDDDGTQTRTLSFEDCWMGDVGVGGSGTWIEFNSGRVLKVSGGSIFSAGEQPAGRSISVGGAGPNSVNAVAVIGVFLQGPIGISFPVPNGCRSAFVAGCDLPPVPLEHPENCRALVTVGNDGLSNRFPGPTA